MHKATSTAECKQSGSVRRLRPRLIAPAERLVTLKTSGWLSLAAAIGILAFFSVFRSLGLTLVLAYALAFVGMPFVRWLEARGRLSRGFASGLTLVIAGSFLLSLSLMVLPTLVRQLTDLVQRLPEAISLLENQIEATFRVKVPHDMSEISSRLSGDVMARLGEILRGNVGTLQSGAEGLLKLVSHAGDVVGAFFQAVFIPIIAFFLMLEWEDFGDFVKRLIPSARRGLFSRLTDESARALTSLVRGQITVALVLIVIYAVGLSLSRVPLALAIAIISGVCYLIPYASATVCVVLSFLFLALEQESLFWWPLAGALMTAIFVQVFEGWFLTPRVVGENAGLSPLAVILAIFILGNVFGFVGVLFALPIATILSVLLDSALDRSASVEEEVTA